MDEHDYPVPMDNTLLSLLRELAAREVYIANADEWISKLEQHIQANGLGLPGVRPKTVILKVLGV